jgi:RimJ/RimL family protein N-acetyltransferase
MLERINMNSSIIETKRLILRQWDNEDIPVLAAINQDPKVMEHFPALKTYEETTRFVHANIELHKNGQYCIYAVEIKDLNDLIGFVGLVQVDIKLPFAPAVEILWRIGSQYWDQGYATEAAMAVRDYAFEVLGLSELVTFTVPANSRSIKLMERLGFIHEPAFDFNHPNIPIEHKLSKHVFYRLKKAI